MLTCRVWYQLILIICQQQIFMYLTMGKREVVTYDHWCIIAVR